MEEGEKSPNVVLNCTAYYKTLRWTRFPPVGTAMTEIFCLKLAMGDPWKGSQTVSDARIPAEDGKWDAILGILLEDPLRGL